MGGLPFQPFNLLSLKKISVLNFLIQKQISAKETFCLRCYFSSRCVRLKTLTLVSLSPELSLCIDFFFLPFLHQRLFTSFHPQRLLVCFVSVLSWLRKKQKKTLFWKIMLTVRTREWNNLVHKEKVDLPALTFSLCVSLCVCFDASPPPGGGLGPWSNDSLQRRRCRSGPR